MMDLCSGCPSLAVAGLITLSKEELSRVLVMSLDGHIWRWSGPLSHPSDVCACVCVFVSGLGAQRD